MNRYEVKFYNRFACEDQTRYFIAKNKKHARHLFLETIDKERYGLTMDEIYVCDYLEPKFYGEELITEELAEKERYEELGRAIEKLFSENTKVCIEFETPSWEMEYAMGINDLLKWFRKSQKEGD